MRGNSADKRAVINNQQLIATVIAEHFGRRGGKLFGGDTFGRFGHYVADSNISNVADVFDQTAQIAFRQNAQYLIVLIDDGGHAERLMRDFANGLQKRDVRRNFGNFRAGVHDVFDV